MFKAAIIGCGKPWRSEGATGSGISHGHAAGYRASPLTTLVAVADIVRENAEDFAEKHGPAAIYTDYSEMIQAERPDLVSICTWPHLHEPMVLKCAELGVPAVHCEKPIAPTLAAARRMVQACADAGTVLSFNHQRRFEPPYTDAKAILDSGRIGTLKRLEMPTANLFDWGTHWFDMANHFNGETPVEWVMAQVEPTGGHKVFGVQLEGPAIARVRYQNGVELIMVTGAEYEFTIRVIGTEGSLDLGWDRLTVRTADGNELIEVGAKQKELNGFEHPITDLAESLRDGREPLLSGRKALAATEVIFACYESARRGGRIDFPFAVEDAAIYAHEA